MPLRSWSDDELSDLAYLRVVEGLDWTVVAKRLHKSVAACKARLAVTEGRRTSNGSMPGASPAKPPYEVPPLRRNDCHKHLSAILIGHGKGFPVCGGSR